MIKEFNFSGVPEKDIEELSRELLGKIEYISSGRRDRYLLEKQLEKDLLIWARNFANELKTQYGLEVGHTSFNYWEINRFHIVILIPYHNNDHFKSKNDFRVFVNDLNWKTIGEPNSVEELVSILNKYLEENKWKDRIVRIEK